MTAHSDPAGHAALAICGSLLLALNDRNILPESEIIGVLRDAAITHAQATDGDRELHRNVARLIEGIIDGGNSIRRKES